MNRQSDFPLLLAAQPISALASRGAAPSIPVAANDNDSTSAGPLFACLLANESALYAITREWRYDAAGRKFVRLHVLLDEQFTEIGVRLVRIAAWSRARDLHISMGHGDCAQLSGSAVDEGALEAHIVRDLLDLHEALLMRLQAGKAMAADHFHDSETINLLADLIADHEKDAFMLRALLWEVKNTAA